MNQRLNLPGGSTLLLAALLLPGWTVPVRAQTPTTTAVQGEAVTMHRATGTFEVKVVPLPADTGVDTGGFGRLSLDKRFSGDLQGTSLGQMVAAQTEVEGSAAYVALERVTGTLQGRTGGFILQHSGTMSRGAMELRITVVPDSGSGELAGLTGTMTIIIEGKQHSYVFEYSLGG